MAKVRFSLVLSLLLASSAASAQRLEWSAEWEQPSWSDGVSAAVMLAGSFAISGIAQPTHGSRWTEPGPIDGALTRVISLRDSQTRRRLSIASYFTGAFALAAPISDIGVAFAHDTRVAGHMTQLFALSISSVTLATTFIKYIALRSRPDAGECTSPECGPTRFRSFPSGHASLAFMGASLSCTYHLRVGVYGSRGADIAACGTSLAFALTTAILRVAASKHYLSDVLVGGVLGVLAGWVLPTLLYFGFGDR